MSPRAPHYFLHGNLVFARGVDDAWAAYRLDGESYPGLSLKRKLELKERLEAFAYFVEADFQLIRTAREWSADSYVERALATLDPRHGHPQEFQSLLEADRERLAGRHVVRVETYLFVCLAAPLGAGGLGERLAELRRAAERTLGLGDGAGIGRAQLAELRRGEERCFERLLDYLPCERARSGEVAGLVRSAYTRGLGEAAADPNWRPQALWVEGAADGEDPRFEPYEHDLLRLHEARVSISARGLRIDSELGTSHQAMLVVGALPDQALFPGPEAELLFSALEVGFPVDAVFSAEFVANSQAKRLAQKRMVDADMQAREEGFGEHGESVSTSERTHAARELQGRLAASDRSPLLRAAITLCVGAQSAEALEERVERLRAALGRTALHRPLGEQHRLFLGAMPAQRFPVRDYLAHLLPEQLGAMVPTAISHAGSEIGPYVGHALTGSRDPVLIDLAEAARLNRPPTVLITGSLGSGKTIALQTLLYQAFCQGSAPIVDIDPKGDHRLDSLPGVAAAIEVIELGPDERYRGLLDPMRIATAEGREDLATAFLCAILPQPIQPEWQTEIRAAVAAATRAGARSLGEVLAELGRGEQAAKDVARALEVHLDTGLARLAYGSPEVKPAEVGEAQVVSLRIRNLVRPADTTARSELSEDERASQAILRLLAHYALRLCAASEGMHSVLALDEAWALLADSQGRAVLERFSRMGRSMNITSLISSQIVGDAEALEPLVGSYLAFGVERQAEAERALALLRLDPDDEAARERLVAFRAGRCLYLDHHGRTLPIRVDPAPELLEALDTTPPRAPSAPRHAGAAAGDRGAAAQGAGRDDVAGA